MDLLKHSVLGASQSGMGADFAISTDVIVLLGFTGAALLLAGCGPGGKCNSPQENARSDAVMSMNSRSVPAGS